jgi:predicted flap endonuclease-1-like 5' DNA nuclease
MRQLRVVSVVEGGAAVVVASDSGEQFALPIDDRLRAAVRGDQLREGQLEMVTPSPISPRDIQARVRAGASPAEVAAQAAIPTERVMRFAAPVLDERAHVARQATTALLRTDGLLELGTLGDVVAAALTERGVADGAQWDAWRRDDGRWMVASRWHEAGHHLTALWLLDGSGRSVLPLDDDSRRLAGLPVAEPTGPARLAVVSDHAPDDVDASEAQPPTSEDDTPTGPVPMVPDDEPAEPTRAGSRSARRSRGPDHGERLRLSDIAEHVVEEDRAPAPSRSGGRRTRTEPDAIADSSRRQRPPVPSWDEIMFGRRG